MAFINGNASWVGPSDTPLNLYQCLCGPTACGKEGPRKAIKTLLEAVLIDQSGISESAASAPALLRALALTRSQLVLTDEFALFLQVALSDKGSAHLKELVKELMSLHGLGRSYFAGKKYADVKMNIGKIDKPYVNVFGTTTPLELVDGITLKSVDNGFLNRILFIQASGQKPINRAPDTTLPPAIVAGLKDVFENPKGAMPFADGAEQLMISLADGMKRSGQFANLWGRAEDQMLRVAGNIAIGDGGVITCQHITWAADYVTNCIDSFAEFLGDDLAETGFQKLVAKASKMIRECRKYSTDKQFGKQCKAGMMPRSKLLKLLKIPSYEMDSLIGYLSDSETFRMGTMDGFKVIYSHE